MSKIDTINKRNDILDETKNQKKDLTGKFCGNPFNRFEVQPDGTVAVCCTSWLPESIGNVNDKSMEEIINSEDAQKIRLSILDGSFKYCDHRVCPKIINDDLQSKEEILKNNYPGQKRLVHAIKTNDTTIPYPIHINFLWDRSCNLSCPSCRVEKIMWTKGKKYERILSMQDSILDFVLSQNITDEICRFNITGSGDPFGSKMYREFLFDFDGTKHPNIKIDLQTNGVMFTPATWKRIHKVHDNLSLVMVSVDAATEPTYDIVRRDGNWGMLLENLAFLSEKRKENKMDQLRLDYVVQWHNYKEMVQFVEMFTKPPFDGIDKIHFSMITDWLTWERDEFMKMAIWHENHTEHENFLRVLSSDVFDNSKVSLTNLAAYRK